METGGTQAPEEIGEGGDQPDPAPETEVVDTGEEDGDDDDGESEDGEDEGEDGEDEPEEGSSTAA